MTTELLDRVCAEARATPGDVAAVVHAAVERLAPLGSDDERRRLTERAIARLGGLGILDEYLADPDVDEVIVNGGRDVWVERHGQLVAAGHLDADSVAVVLERVLSPTGRRLDRTHPIVDARLPSGARLCAVVAPVAVDGTCVTIRRHRRRRFELGAFAEPVVVELLADIIAADANVLVTGATSSGKTTLLAALAASADPADRIVVIEDTAELPIDAPHVVRLEARAATGDTVRAVSLDDLVVAAMRLRPDRLIVGEFRGTEVLAVVQALNTGHDGSLSTCHANSAVDGLRRVETLLMQAAPSWPLAAIRRQVSRSLDAIVHLGRMADGQRRVLEVAEVVETDTDPAVRALAIDGDVVAPFTRRRR